MEYGGTENGTINVNSAAMYVRAGSGKHLILGSDGTEKLRIKSDGKIGINDSSPERNVDIRANNVMVQLEGAGGNGRQYSLCSTDDTTGAAVGPAGQFVIYDDTAGSSRVNITSAGNIGIGDANPSNKLTVKSGNGDQLRLDNAGERYTQISLRNNGTQKAAIWLDETDDDLSLYAYTGYGIRFLTNGTESARITSAGNMGLGTNNPTSDGGTTFEIYDDNTPSIRLNDGGAYKSLFQLRGNDLEIRGSNGQLEFYTGNADGASSSLRGAITSAGHKWTHNGSIFHGSNDVTDFTQSSPDTYNNISVRAGNPNTGTTPTNDNSAIKIYPAGTRSSTAGNLTGGIAWQHLDPNNGSWASNYGPGAQIWMGAALHDTPGQGTRSFQPVDEQSNIWWFTTKQPCY